MAQQTTTTPIVSCVMATKDRPSFLEQAIGYYRKQSYENSELVIVDDSSKSCRSLIPQDSRIRYLHLPVSTLLGAKLNMAIQNSSGTIIQKLDDDDYYHPLFLETMVRTLLQQGQKNAIAAMGSFLVLILGHTKLYRSGPGWFAGGTYCFFRQAWADTPFRNVPRRVDVSFLEDHPALLRSAVLADELYVVVRHGNHTWNTMVPEVVIPDRNLRGEDVTIYFSKCQIYKKSPAEVMGLEAATFYERLFLHSGERGSARLEEKADV